MLDVWSPYQRRVGVVRKVDRIAAPFAEAEEGGRDSSRDSACDKTAFMEMWSVEQRSTPFFLLTPTSARFGEGGVKVSCEMPRVRAKPRLQRGKMKLETG